MPPTILSNHFYRYLEKPQNYYELLGVPARGVTKSELKKAFRAASIKYHPDKNPDDDTTDLFIQVKEANDIIGDEQMRFAYDVYSQTNWDQEDTIRKGLKYSKKMTEEEADKLFWHIINNKRMFQSGLEIFPYYFAWVMAVILLVNVSQHEQELWCFRVNLLKFFYVLEIVWKTFPRCSSRHDRRVRIRRKDLLR